jgi:hypothetical protein
MLMQGDKDGEAEAEDEDRDQEVGVGEDGFGSLGFVHWALVVSDFDDR